MNLRFSDNVTRIAAVAGFAGLLLLLALTLADYLTRDRPRQQGQAPVARVELLDTGDLIASDAK
jgi:hypothetical protein